MPELVFDPAVARGSSPEFFQAIRVVGPGGVELARARWHVTGDGVVQLVELYVHPPHRRTGLAKQLLAATIDQARQHHAARRRRLRRMWAVVAQKTHVVARAFLTHHAFHHVATQPDLLKGEDALTYVRSFD